MKDKVILDASFFLSYLLPDEEQTHPEIFKKIISGEVTLLEPYLFYLEVLNALMNARKSKRITTDLSKSLISRFAKLSNIEYVYRVNAASLMSLAQKYNLSVYDAVYLSLKIESGYPLYTLDQSLSKISL